MGNLSRTKGNALELRMDWVHRDYLQRGLAKIRHQGTIAEFHNGRWTPRESLPDYGGALKGGRCVSFDAKHISGFKYSHPKGRMHQCNHMLDIHEMGGLAFILVVSDDVERGWAVRPQDFWAADRGWSLHLDAATDELAIEVPCWRDAVGLYVPDWITLLDII
jgi:penicillin-binding protein-related factor A (putative recombinase)